MSESVKAYYQKHKEEIKARAREYKKANREHYTDMQKRWAKANPEAARAIGKRTREKNKDALKARKKVWYLKNAERIKAKSRARYATDPAHRAAVLAFTKTPEQRAKIRIKKRTKEHRVKFNAHRNKRLAKDLNFKIRSRLGSRLSNAVRLGRGAKSASTMELIGCAVEFLKAHLERLFTPGMSWEAFNRGEIHIDHKKPCVKFDLTDEAQQRECFNFRNLQPLWQFDNISKHGKYELTIKVAEVKG